MNFFQSRITAIDSFPFSYESMEVEQEIVKSMLDEIDRILSINSPLKTANISLMDRNSIVELLLNFDSSNSEVYFFGLSYNIGLKLPYHVFCNYYDDLWYPSSDDVLIYDTNNAFCVEISHEEIVTHWIIG